MSKLVSKILIAVGMTLPVAAADAEPVTVVDPLGRAVSRNVIGNSAEVRVIVDPVYLPLAEVVCRLSPIGFRAATIEVIPDASRVCSFRSVPAGRWALNVDGSDYFTVEVVG